jgi:hypothetical protein
MDKIDNNSVKGRVRAHEVWGESESSLIWTPTTEFSKNLVLYQWSQIVGKLLTSGDSRYRIGGLYLEFENVASPGSPVSVPTFDRTRDIAYYNSLSGSAVRDYLRVPLTAATTADEATESVLTFFARSSSSVGVHGKTFSDSVNSTIFGASLVAYVDSTDVTQDLLLSSYYFAVADQQQKLATSQVGLEWQLSLQ